MRKHYIKLGLAGSVLVLALIGPSIALALPQQANAHAETTDTSATTNDSSSGVTSHQPTTTGQANGQAHLAAAQLKACQNREAAINNIMGRIDTRAQNQLTLFGTVATRVENFYTSKSETVSNYDQLVVAIASAKSQTETDFGTMQANSTFDCSASNPKGMVTAFQGYLKTEISDLQNYRTSVKNLIVAVAQANGVTVSNQSSAQGGQQ
ncbi:MAG TPA: hypothetical protein VF261_00205 [Candidatus Saccharimonadales bacterium]